MKNLKTKLINVTSTSLSVVALVGTLAFAAPAKAGGSDDFIKILGAVVIMDQLFNNNRNDNRNYDDRYYNGRNNGQYGYNGYGNGRVYDDRGVHQRTCNDNLGCAPRDNNRWNEPRKYGYAQGRDTGQVCGQRVEHYQGYSETLHLDCNGNVMYVTRHRK